MTKSRVESPDEDHGAPAHLIVQDPEDLRRKLREGLESGPAVELTDADWDARRRALRQRHGLKPDGQ